MSLSSVKSNPTIDPLPVSIVKSPYKTFNKLLFPVPVFPIKKINSPALTLKLIDEKITLFSLIIVALSRVTIAFCIVKVDFL